MVLRGGESMKDLLKSRGIIRDENQSINLLQPKPCPSCHEPNQPNAQFCQKCNFVLDFSVYQKSVKERKRKDQELNLLTYIRQFKYTYSCCYNVFVVARN